MAAFPFFNSVLFGWLLFTGAVWIKRALWLGSLKKTDPPLIPRPFSGGSPPKISVIVPAKDEERNISHCLQHLLEQSYPDFEIVVVDDRSVDETPQLVEMYRKNARRPVRYVRIEKLPPGWTGKNHAMHAGAAAAAGSWLLFTDADTTHFKDSLSTAMAAALERGIDFLTLAPQTTSESFWEKTVQPLAVSSLALWFDPRRVNDPKGAGVLANGQFILVKKEVYEKTGGSEAVKDKVVEDVEFAKNARKAGFRVNFLDGTRLYSTRMYTSLAEIHRGWTRIFIHLFDKKILPILHKIALFVFFSILPFAALGLEIGRAAAHKSFDAGIFWAALVVSLFIVAVRFVGNRRVGANPWFAFLHPLGSLVMVWILMTCIYRIAFDRPSLWRGDRLR